MVHSAHQAHDGSEKAEKRGALATHHVVVEVVQGHETSEERAEEARDRGR